MQKEVLDKLLAGLFKIFHLYFFRAFPLSRLPAAAVADRILRCKAERNR